MDPQSPIHWIARQTGAAQVTHCQSVQTLWRGWGRIDRYALTGCSRPSIILKRICPPTASLDMSSQRKRRSYEVEHHFYAHYAERLNPTARVPQMLGHHTLRSEQWLLLEDLDAAGFPRRTRHIGPSDLQQCLTWLAGFHASTVGGSAHGLWQHGSYWHLRTRPDEYAQMPAGPLKDAAHRLDNYLRAEAPSCIIHGDAKPANFCFAPTEGAAVAAVDFQYTGSAPGIVDVAYLLGCMPTQWLNTNGAAASEAYFCALRSFGVSAKIVEGWRSALPVAWADYARFALGWARADWRDGGYGESQILRGLEVVRL